MDRALCGFPAQFYAEIPHNFVRVSRMYKDIIKTHIKIQKRKKHIPLMLFSMTGGGGFFYGFYLNIFGRHNQ
jgi:hypothetical protein